MYLISEIKSNTGFNSCGIIAYSNVPNTATLEPSGYKQTKKNQKKLSR